MSPLDCRPGRPPGCRSRSEPPTRHLDPVGRSWRAALGPAPGTPIKEPMIFGIADDSSAGPAVRPTRCMPGRGPSASPPKTLQIGGRVSVRPDDGHVVDLYADVSAEFPPTGLPKGLPDGHVADLMSESPRGTATGPHRLRLARPAGRPRPPRTVCSPPPAEVRPAMIPDPAHRRPSRTRLASPGGFAPVAGCPPDGPPSRIMRADHRGLTARAAVDAAGYSPRVSGRLKVGPFAWPGW